MTEAILEVHDLTCGYDPDQPVLRHADLEVRRGEVLMIIGGSGSGKSTLLRTMSGLMAPLAGEVCMFGEPLDAADRYRRAALLRRTGMLFQHDALFGSLTLRENVALPVCELTDLPGALAEELAQRKLDLVGVGDLAFSLPSEISGGQRKRAALARAIVLDPELLFCDEPTSGLDPMTAAHIDALLLRLRDVFGITIVTVTHDIDSVTTSADRGLVVGDGRILATGSSAELVACTHPDVYPFFHRADVLGAGAAR